MKFSSFSGQLVKIISTFFFIGYLPLIPGTFGSIAGVGIFYLLGSSSSAAYFLFIICLITLGLLTSGRTEKLLGRKDPGCIVIDEVMGMLVSLSFIPHEPGMVFLAFLIFRIFDTLKPFPASKLQGLHGSLGVVGDDFVAGVYTNAVLQIILRLNSSITV